MNSKSNYYPFSIYFILWVVGWFAAALYLNFLPRTELK